MKETLKKALAKARGAVKAAGRKALWAVRKTLAALLLAVLVVSSAGFFLLDPDNEK